MCFSHFDFKLLLNMHVLVYDFPWEFWDEIILRGESVKPVKKFKFRFLRKRGKMVIYRNSQGGKAEIFLDLG